MYPPFAFQPVTKWFTHFRVFCKILDFFLQVGRNEPDHFLKILKFHLLNPDDIGEYSNFFRFSINAFAVVHSIKSPPAISFSATITSSITASLIIDSAGYSSSQSLSFNILTFSQNSLKHHLNVLAIRCCFHNHSQYTMFLPIKNIMLMTKNPGPEP